MGLYLCVLDAAGEEAEGVEVGSYADFNAFRDALRASALWSGAEAACCPVLTNHSDCDGMWTSEEAERLLSELSLADRVMREQPAIELTQAWKLEVAKTMGIRPATLLDCFFDVDGEPLVERLMQLANASVGTGRPILFQ
jgi:hypothetical protein